MKGQDLDKTLECTVCEGTGEDPVTVVCKNCRGEGKMGKVQCPECDGDGELNKVCRRCDGHGSINRYGPNDPHPDHGHDDRRGDCVILREWVNDDGALIVEEMPIEADSGGFNGRYSNEVPSDMNEEPVASFQQDTKDRLKNELGASGPYQMPEDGYDGVRVDGNKLAGGTYPSACKHESCQNGDLCRDHILSWLRARNDEHTARVLENAFDECDV